MFPAKIARFVYTVRYLKLIQIFGRIKRKSMPLRRLAGVPPDLVYRQVLAPFARQSRTLAFTQSGATFFGRYQEIGFARSWLIEEDELDFFGEKIDLESLTGITLEKPNIKKI